MREENKMETVDCRGIGADNQNNKIRYIVLETLQIEDHFPISIGHQFFDERKEQEVSKRKRYEMKRA